VKFQVRPDPVGPKRRSLDSRLRGFDRGRRQS
jgi:hypothetical protein